MNFRAVTSEIAFARLQRLSAQVLYVTAAAALFAALQMHSDLGAHALGAALFGSLAGIYLAVAQRGGRMRELELCERSAPLYAREVARAVALVPSIGVVIALSGYWIVTAISSGSRDLAAAPIFLSMTCACAVAVVALGATVRDGIWQAAYILLAGITATIIVVLEYPQLPAAFLFCGIAGFIGLRQSGEALARWNPIPPA
jgi:predicted membrane protein